MGKVFKIFKFGCIIIKKHQVNLLHSACERRDNWLELYSYELNWFEHITEPLNVKKQVLFKSC